MHAKDKGQGKTHVFSNRMHRSRSLKISNLSFSKLSQGKTLSFFNSCVNSWMTVRMNDRTTQDRHSKIYKEKGPKGPKTLSMPTRKVSPVRRRRDKKTRKEKVKISPDYEVVNHIGGCRKPSTTATEKKEEPISPCLADNCDEGSSIEEGSKVPTRDFLTTDIAEVEFVGSNEDDLMTLEPDQVQSYPSPFTHVFSAKTRKHEHSHKSRAKNQKGKIYSRYRICRSKKRKGTSSEHLMASVYDGISHFISVFISFNKL